VRRNNRRFNRRNATRNNKPKSKSRRPAHVSVYSNDYEHPEKLVRRFLKKCKKEKILDQVRANQHFEKPSVKRHRAKLKRKADIKKANKEATKKL
jgi:ribosomal protein S21